ncbi:hypothetical protein ACFRFJ_20975 [Streptomyces hydrogenans]|uniref:hypothetical protein n=1 Tax=Streptomyces hydrogenans TaxID=1873719 RepID=UPI00369DB95D
MSTPLGQFRVRTARRRSMLLAAGCGEEPPPYRRLTGGDHGFPHPDLYRTYEATKKYRSAEKAIADGFDRDFDGPEPIPGLGKVYSLHAWIYEENPSGVFAPYNPRVRCGPCPE